MHNKNLKMHVRNGARIITDQYGATVATFPDAATNAEPGYFGYACFVNGLTGFPDASLYDMDADKQLFGPLDGVLAIARTA